MNLCDDGCAPRGCRWLGRALKWGVSQNGTGYFDQLLATDFERLLPATPVRRFRVGPTMRHPPDDDSRRSDYIVGLVGLRAGQSQGQSAVDSEKFWPSKALRR